MDSDFIRSGSLGVLDELEDADGALVGGLEGCALGLFVADGAAREPGYDIGGGWFERISWAVGEGGESGDGVVGSGDAVETVRWTDGESEAQAAHCCVSF